MDVSVCIVNWNTRDLLHTCVRSIREKTSGLSYEIIIVDNDSHDGSAEMIKNEFPDCTLIQSDNVGFAKGNNKAIHKAKGNYILFLNPDTELVTNAVCGMFSFLEDKKEFGAVGCKLINPDGSIQYTCACTFPTPFRQLCYIFGLNKLFPKSKLFTSSELDYWDHMNDSVINALSGACIMVRKSIIDSIGGFDEGTFMYSEDLDLCFRIKKYGWKIYYLASETIIHRSGSSSAKQKNKNFATLMVKQSNYYFLKKNFGYTAALQLKIISCVGALWRIALISFLSPFLILLRRKNSGVKEILDKYTNIFFWSIGLRKQNY